MGEEADEASPRESLNIFGTNTCPNGRNSCPGYGDLETRKYCCPSPLQPDGYFCCDYRERYSSTSQYFQNLPGLTAGLVGCLVISAMVLGCLFCRCCLLYKLRHRRKQYSQQTETILSSSSSSSPSAQRNRLRSRWRPHTIPVMPVNNHRRPPPPQLQPIIKYGMAYAYSCPHQEFQCVGPPISKKIGLRNALHKDDDDEEEQHPLKASATKSCDDSDCEAPPSYAIAHYYPTVPPKTTAGLLGGRKRVQWMDTDQIDDRDQLPTDH